MRRGRKRAAFPEPVTEGQRLLQAVCHTTDLTYEQIQQKVGAQTPGAVMLWLQGKRRPDNETRARLAAEFEIAPRSWDQRPSVQAGRYEPHINGQPATREQVETLDRAVHAASSPPPAAPPPPPPPPARSTSTLESCLNVLDDIRGARADVQLLPSERIKLADAEARILTLRARLERAAELTEDRVVREHPEWQRLKRLILKALMPHPAALKDVTGAIGESLDAPQGSNGHSR